MSVAPGSRDSRVGGTPPRQMPGWARDLAAWLALALATLVVLWPLGLTNRILAGVDAFTYFDPYWGYRMAELRAGHLPLWNPYLFLGVPYLANPQAAVLYPLHWPLSWMTSQAALVWSALLHIWLAAGFTYTLARRSYRLTRPAAWLAGVLFGLGGFTLARVENINQLNALAWFPALLWLYDETVAAQGWRKRVRWTVALTAVIALQLLAGHTQTTFINLLGLGLYALAPLALQLRRVRPRGYLEVILPRLAPLLAVIPAVMLSAAQLLPTLELNTLGLRTGGLPYRQTVSFSLHPRLLAQTFLPPFGGKLAEAFASEGYAEFVGYVSVVGLVLAGLGLAHALRRPADGERRALIGPVLLVAAGLFLALGAYNPAYYVLWRFVPGFALFRAPARWLELYALGIALLAGYGLDALRLPGPSPVRRLGPYILRQAGLIFLALVGVILLAIQQMPPLVTLGGWLAALLAATVLIRAGKRFPRVATAGLVALALCELWLGGRALPFTQATAPLAAGLRNAPAALLAATADQPPAGRDRFLSLSDIRYDPGDLAALRELQADRLPGEAVERMVRAAKQTEVIAPNLSLRFRLPAVDGYDGGLLPLGRYVRLQSLFLPAESLVPDGRLREQLQQIPADRLLDLTGVRFVITDKQRDLWAEDVYYDLQHPATVLPGEALTLDLAGYPPFSATGLGLVAEAAGAAGNAALGEIIIAAGADRVAFPLNTGGALTPGTLTPVRLEFPAPLTPNTITITADTDGPGLLLRGLSLIDGRTAAHTSITVSPRGDLRRIHSGDVKVYERVGSPGRAWLVHAAAVAADDAAALRILSDPGFEPRTEAVLAEGPAAADLPPQRPAAPLPGEAVTVVDTRAEQVTLRAEVTAPALLVLADTFYPGWQATVDGAPVPILRANLMFRALALTPGTHEIVLSYQPASWRWGAAVSLVLLLGLLVALVLTYAGRRISVGRRTPGVV